MNMINRCILAVAFAGLSLVGPPVIAKDGHNNARQGKPHHHGKARAAERHQHHALKHHGGHVEPVARGLPHPPGLPVPAGLPRPPGLPEPGIPRLDLPRPPSPDNLPRPPGLPRP
ncbi:MAG: hypothetical protein EXR39_11455 [Betaproteobacteria bacterium]|nr:hypothetical protein [Betaproteobacteria bacterium]